ENQVPLEELRSWLEREAADNLRPIKEQGEKLIGKLKDRLEDFKASCGKLLEEAEKGIERGKAVRKAKVTQKLSRYFLKQVEKIVFPGQMSYSELEGFHTNLEKVLSSITRERNGWFPRISPSFILARRRVDFSLSRLSSSITELSGFLSKDYSKGESVERLFLQTDEMVRLIRDLEKHVASREGIEAKMQHLLEMGKSTQESLETLNGKEELNELAENKIKVQQLRKQVNHSLRHLRKPLTKFANLSRGPGFSLSSEEADKLTQYLEDPFLALSTEKAGYPTLKGILIKVDRAISESKLKLKSSRLRKGLESINAITSTDVLNSLHRECNEAFSLNQNLTQSKETKIAKSKLKQLRRRLAESQRRREALETRRGSWESEHKDMLEKIEALKSAIEKSVYETLEKTINIKTN
ncbi:MAG: hypothetical protein NWF11_01805, partial [Candidatus Bathyarchaeota archaeon]|nr:hypothetical protein [Candidatus Bathyarchaeota archaeon]